MAPERHAAERTRREKTAQARNTRRNERRNETRRSETVRLNAVRPASRTPLPNALARREANHELMRRLLKLFAAEKSDNDSDTVKESSLDSDSDGDGDVPSHQKVMAADDCVVACREGVVEVSRHGRVAGTLAAFFDGRGQRLTCPLVLGGCVKPCLRIICHVHPLPGGRHSSQSSPICGVHQYAGDRGDLAGWKANPRLLRSVGAFPHPDRVHCSLLLKCFLQGCPYVVVLRRVVYISDRYLGLILKDLDRSPIAENSLDALSHCSGIRPSAELHFQVASCCPLADTNGELNILQGGR
uniref:Uncharacterized protein n=1 Tax=Anopheles farauti TaxID=69004 RepID=A0A182QJM9_9DIPT